MSSKVLGLGTAPVEAGDPTDGMCDPCRDKYRQSKDIERRCDRKGCTGTWTWTVAEQMEAFATQRPAPKRLCAQCQTLLDSLQDKQVPCAIPGCTRSAVLTRQQQLIAQSAEGTPAPTTNEAAPAKTDGVTFTGLLCDECAHVARKLKDRPVTCGINGCSRKWTWTADEQIQAFAAGKPNEPPRRMCAECRAEFGKLADREVRCRTSGCKNTWTWSRFDQLDACQAGKPAPKAPSRMCQRCFDLWSTLKDVERPCRRAGCKGTWTDKRGAQLARAVRGKGGDPYPRHCSNCEKELGDLEDREIKCRTEGCQGTWTWTKEQQLAAGVRPKIKEVAPAVAESEAQPAQLEAPAPATPAAEGTPAAEPAPQAGAAPTAARPEKKNKRNRRRRDPQPPERRCSACAEFLAGRKTQEIPCIQCGTPIFWPPESQLQTHLGIWAAPALCGACKLAQVSAAREAAREALRHASTAPVAEPAETASPADSAQKPAETASPADSTQKPAETASPADSAQNG